MSGDFTERLRAGSAFDRTGDTLGEEQPPGNDVPVPGVYEDVDRLVE